MTGNEKLRNSGSGEKREMQEGPRNGRQTAMNFVEREKSYFIEDGEVHVPPSKFGSSLKQVMERKQLLEGNICVVKFVLSFLVS